MNANEIDGGQLLRSELAARTLSHTFFFSFLETSVEWSKHKRLPFRGNLTNQQTSTSYS